MEKLPKFEFLIVGIIFGMLVIPIHFAEAVEWKLYVGDMPKHWESKFGNLLYHATQYWQNQFPETTFYKVSNLENADFVIQWASEYQSDEKTNTKRSGYYTTNFKNEYGKPYVAITLGFMTGEGINKKFQLVDEEYALLITVHEIGHAIGLGHSDNSNNIMYPSIYNYQKWLELKETSDLQQSSQTQNEITESNLSDLAEIKSIPTWIKNNAAYADSTIPSSKSNSDNAFTAATFADKYKDMLSTTGKRVSVVITVAGDSDSTDPSKRAKEIRYLQSYVLKFLSFSNAVNVVSDQQKNEITAQIHTELIPILEKRRDVISVTVLEEIQEITKEELDQLPPKKQQHEGRGIDEIQCKPDYILMVKSSGDPACVKSMSAEKLVLRGWGEIYQQ